MKKNKRKKIIIHELKCNAGKDTNKKHLDT